MAVHLEEFVDTIENLPGELKHYLAEIRTRDDQAQDLRKQIMAQQKSFTNVNNGNNGNSKDDQSAEGSGASNNKTLERIRKDYRTAQDLAQEKISLSDRALELLSRHIKRLDEVLTEASKSIDESALPPTLFSDVTPTVDKRKHRVSSSSHGLDTPLVGRSSSGGGGSRSSRKPPRHGAAYNLMDVDEDMEDTEDGGDGEPVYCICQQVSFGEMIACDNAEKCPYEWFHYECVGLSEPPQGTWYCPICLPKMQKKQ